jgi:ROK family protein (putative glucokinase)
MVYIGIDLGGTNIAVGIVDEKGNILSTASTRTLASRPYQEVIKDMALCALEALKKSGKTADDAHSIGVGVPGVARAETGVVVFCTNLGWTEVPLRAEMQKYINKPVNIDNDATVAGLAESLFGGSAKTHSSVFLTLGTGVGGGIIIEGKPWSGYHGIGSEVGHMTLVADGIQCTCGKKGCMERYCSATAIGRMGREAMAKYPDSLIAANCGGNPERVNAKVVFDAAKAGDKAGVEVFNEYVKYLSLGINSMITFFDPEVIVLGGGVSAAGDFLLNAVREAVPKLRLFQALPCAKIELATLGNAAGIIGAAMLGR